MPQFGVMGPSILLLFVLFASTLSCAAELDIANSPDGLKIDGVLDPDMELGSGLIIDSTITPFGHSFSQYLSSLLLFSGHKLISNLEIHERPSARKGTLIELSYLGELVFAKRYTIQRADAEGSVKDVVNAILDNIAKVEVQRVLVSPDLGASDF